MLLNFGGPLVASHAAIYPLLPHVGSVSPERLVSPGRIRSRRRTRPGSAALGPRFLHPSGSFPDGVPSSLFKLQPRSTPTASPPRSPPPPSGSSEVEESTTAVATTPSVVEEAMEALDVRLAEEADLPDISALLADVFEPNILIDPAELRSESSVEKLEQANKYLKEMAYKKILRAIKSRCGSRLRRGDFALTSDALVLAVRDNRSSTGASAAPAAKDQDQELGGDDGGGNRDGEVVAVVELCLRQPDGWLPINGFLQPPMGWEPYMCNLAVAEKYRGNGYGKQLALLCENVAKNHWGYERMYLHVDAASSVAMGMYSSLGYEIKQQFEAPLWIRQLFGLRDIRYQVKHFGRKRGPRVGGE